MLLAHCGARFVTRETLELCVTPQGTDTWKPIAHSDLVGALNEEIQSRGLVVRKESYAVQKDDTKLFGTIDLEWQNNGEYAAALGLRTANDKSLSIQIAVGMRVLVCDNLAFSGDIIALRRKHTKNLNLRQEISRGLDRYQEGVLSLGRDIERLKTKPLNPPIAKEYIFDIFRKKVVPMRLFHLVVDEWDKMAVDGYGSEWQLHNAFTEHFKQLSPAVAFNATRIVGKFFEM